MEKKLIKNNRTTPLSSIKNGEIFYREGNLDKAIICFDDEIKQHPQSWEARNYKGSCLLNKNKLQDAKTCFEQALAIDNNQPNTWCFLGTYYFKMHDIDTAYKCYSKAEELGGNELIYSHVAYFFNEIGEYTQSVNYIEKVLSLNNNNESALNTKGLVLINQEDYKSAIKIFENLTKLNSTNSMFRNNLGYAHLCDENEIKAKEELDKSLSIDPNNSFALNNVGILFFKQADYINAWEYFDKATTINPDTKKFWENKAECLIRLLITKNTSFGNFYNVGCYLSKADLNIVDIIAALNNPELQLEQKNKDDILLEMLKADDFFYQTVKDTKVNMEDYKTIYLSSLQIVSLLNTDHHEELDFAHYTTLETANALIFQNSPFRLHSVTTANDPKEGLPILSFLGFGGAFSPIDYQAFVGSFTFNPDSLNQFRLYGKDNNMEGTGVSLLLSFDYFEENASLNKELFSPSTQLTKIKKEPLFRCVYIDPLSKRVISLGHKEPCVFYRENMEYSSEEIDTDVNNYLEHINGLKIKVENSLNELSTEINILFEKFTDDPIQRTEAIKIIPLLLIHLRYLIKHSDFKEEQECRIIKVEPLKNNNKIIVSNDGNRMYLNYLIMSNIDNLYSGRVYWGPKTVNYELFKDRIKHSGLEIRCCKNEHPFS